ncbi:MAG: carboxypeptidase-like regulatory domain-containing protein [Alicyclobacillus sp.]|nr:carboxypeptidase-like regulatory domain-containing protein [Alicyclobacillus sp.]
MSVRIPGMAAVTAAIVLAAPAVTDPVPLSAQAAGVTAAVSFHLSRTQLPVEPWGAPDGQLYTVRGRLEVNGRPVSGVTLSCLNQTCRTAADGSFAVQVPTGGPARVEVRVRSTSGSTVGGQALSPHLAQLLQRAEGDILVAFPILLWDHGTVSKDGRSVTVRGKLQVPAAISLAYQLDKYALQGRVYNAAGKPVRGAVVSLTSDGGEGWAKSAPTGADGFYRFKFMPDSDSDVQFRLTVGHTEYVLPPSKVFHFPDGTSSEVDVTLPKTGRVIVDRPPTLVAHTVGGAYYQGVAVGLMSSRGVCYPATVPRADGSFTVTLPRSVWQRGAKWYETIVDAYFARPVRPGQPLSAAVAAPGAGDPVGIVPG